MVGIKSRECYECPAALLLIQAHQTLEQLCLDAETLKQKAKMDVEWASTVYRGLWFSQNRNAIDHLRRGRHLRPHRRRGLHRPPRSAVQDLVQGSGPRLRPPAGPLGHRRRQRCVLWPAGDALGRPFFARSARGLAGCSEISSHWEPENEGLPGKAQLTRTGVTSNAN